MTPDLSGPKPSGQTLRLEAEYWTLVYDGAVCRLRDAKGLRHLAHLLRQPHVAVPAFELDRGTETEPDEAARERARVNVTRAIGAALRRIERHHPALAAHLANTVHTGSHCAYRPDPRVPIVWE